MYRCEAPGPRAIAAEPGVGSRGCHVHAIRESAACDDAVSVRRKMSVPQRLVQVGWVAAWIALLLGGSCIIWAGVLATDTTSLVQEAGFMLLRQDSRGP